MAFDKQVEELCAVYAEKTDEELLDLHEQRDDLTDAAQQALAQVLRERKLSPAATPAPTMFVSQTPEIKSGAMLADNEVCVWTFDDAFQAREALRHLSDAEIEHRVVDSSQKSGDAFRGSTYQLQLGVIVDRHDVKAATAVLQTMGLFPGPEGDDAPSENILGDLALLSMFDLKDALLAAQALGEAGISYLWRDGRDPSQQLPDAQTVAIEVHPEELERATLLVQEKLGD